MQPAASLHVELLFDSALLSHIIKMTTGGNNWHVFGSGGEWKPSCLPQPRRNQSRCACVVCGSACDSRHRQLLESLFLCLTYATLTHKLADLQMDPAVCLADVRMTLDQGLTLSEFDYGSDTDNQTKRARKEHFMVIAKFKCLYTNPSKIGR